MWNIKLETFNYSLFGGVPIELTKIVWDLLPTTANNIVAAVTIFTFLKFILPNSRVCEKEADYVGLMMLAKVISISI